MHFVRWLAVLWLVMISTAWSATVPPELVSVRSWVAPPEADSLSQAAELLRSQPIQTRSSGDRYTFEVPARQPTWFAIELPALARPSTLELTHPSLRAADLYLPGQPEPVARSGRDLPVAQRLHHRFPAAVPLPASAEPRTVYLRVHARVAARGEFQLHGRQQWETLSRLEIAGMALGFGVSVVAALYALLMAAWKRSSAYLLYCLLTLAIVASALFITGLGEGLLWPQLGPWRGQAAAFTACLASGLALLLAERAFALEVSAPRFALALRTFGVLFPLAGAAVLPLPLPVQQAVSHVAAVGAMLLGMSSIWLAWRTANPVAVWLLAGYAPVVLGVGVVTLAIARVIPFADWVLLVLPLAAMLEIPFNLHGLRLLEERRADVRRGRRQLEAQAGPEEGESREEVAQRLELPPADATMRPPGATLMLLRFEGLKPGAPGRLRLDEVAVERYLQAMMHAGLRPGSRVGRWSSHELLLRDMHHRAPKELDGLVTALFAQSLRSERFGIPAQQTGLRIAYVRALSVELPVRGLARQLSQALDDPLEQDMRRIQLDPWVD